ncbi:MAG TPA: hypothetical protein VJG48_02490 [Candidatus Paceibacterota bacterium]
MDPDFCSFSRQDSSKLATCVYGTSSFRPTSSGVAISSFLRDELRRFLAAFNLSTKVERTPYYRIDAYFNEKGLWILEINASFVDGWGTALNLARASGIKVNPGALVFPKYFATKDPRYLPELRLFVDELARLGVGGHEIREWDPKCVEPTYVYGRVGSKELPFLLPYDGIRLDNKLNLALLREWGGDRVHVPVHYIAREVPWEATPSNAVLKFCDKGSAECARAKQSVILGKPSGAAPFLKRCYREEKLIAQDFVSPAKTSSGVSSQIVILAVGSEPVAGYVQWSRDRIINDNCTHGPLVFLDPLC